MPHNAAPLWSFTAAAAPQPDQLFSVWQERSYLLTTLAAEKSHAERLLKALDSRRAELKETEKTDNNPGSTASIRKAIGGINRKLKRCYKSQNAMANNLADLNMRMQEAEEVQWMRSQQSWTHQARDQWLNGMQAAMQGLSVGEPAQPSPLMYPPATPYLHPHYIPLSPITPFATSSIGPYDGLDSVHQTPISPRSVQTPPLNWSWTDSPIFPLYTPFYASSFDGPYFKPPSMSSPTYMAQQTVQYTAESPPASQIDESLESVKVRQLRRFQPSRAFSAPDIITGRRASVLSSPNEVEGFSDKSRGRCSLELERRLSLFDGAGAGIRLQGRTKG